MEENKPRAVCYARVSTTEQSENGYSLRQQMERLRSWCAEEGYEIAEEITDPGHSGAYLERPGLDRVRDLVAAGGVAVVLAQDRDRFAREPAYLYLLREEFAAKGARLRALNDRGDESPEGELTDGILDQLAKFERAKTAERTRRGLDRKVAEGRIVRGNSRPFGMSYSDDGETLYPSEPEMGVLRRMFHMVGVEGESMGEVQRVLRREGVPSAHGGDWPRSTIRYLLNNELYLPRSPEELEGLIPEAVRSMLDRETEYGLWTWNKSRTKRWRVRGDDGEYRNRIKIDHRPREQWSAVPVCLEGSGLQCSVVEAARERLAANYRQRRTVSENRVWLLSGGMARCATCGNGLAVHRVYHGEKKHLYYRCYTRYNTGHDACSNNRHNRAEPLEGAVWNGVRSLLADPERLQGQYEAYLERRRRKLRGDPDRKASDLAGRLADLDEERRGYLRQNARGAISDSDLDAMLAEVDDKREGVRGALAEATERQQTLARLATEREEVFGRFRAMSEMDLRHASSELRRKVLQALRVTVEVDEEGNATIRGIFDADIGMLLPMDDAPAGAPYSVHFNKEIPEPHAGLVSIDSSRRFTS